MMYIYELPLSLYSFKLRLAIALKGATIEGRAPPGGSYRSAEFKRINPAGTIPALVDGDFVLAESDAIVEYLDDRQIGTRLLPPDAEGRARTRMLSRWCDTRLEPAVRTLFPLVKAAHPDAGIIAAAEDRIASALTLFENALDAQGPSALGAEAGLADCGITATALWLTAIAPLLKLSTVPGPKVARLVEAMATRENTGPLIRDYRALISRWTGEQEKLRSAG